jgi:type III pantothenate kinase
MILAADVKNTYITFGCIEGTEILQVFTVATDLSKTEFEYAVEIKGILNFYGMGCSVFSGVIMSSVVPSLSPVMRESLRLLTGQRALVVGAGVKTGLNILIDNPAQLGADLVASGVGALAEYRPPLIIIDLSTAIAISVIDAKSNFLGGAIAPGLDLSLKALRTIGSLLTEVTFEAPRRCIGTNTDESMKSGTVLGIASLVDGMIGRMEEELGVTAASIIATGTYADAIVPHCRSNILRDESLALKGLAAIYLKNIKNR